MIPLWFTRKFFPSIVMALLVAGCCNSGPTQPATEKEAAKEQQVSFIYEDEFSANDKAKLETWIQQTSDAAQKVLGQYPFALYYHFHREDSARGAVVFGHTVRTDSTNAAHFYVDPSYSLHDLKADWIAPHEISHLAIPKLPKACLWFYEGFATYMSRQIMIETGIYTTTEVDSINQARICAVKEKFETTSLLPKVADSLIAKHQYPPVYWLGASFFDQANQQLRAEGKIPLVDVLKKFQACCHTSGMSIDTIISSFDKVSESIIFSKLYTHYTTTPCNQLLVEYKP